MAFTQADLDVLDKAIASGTKRIRYPDGSEVEYQSLRDLTIARAKVADALAAAATVSGPASRTEYAGF